MVQYLRNVSSSRGNTQTTDTASRLVVLTPSCLIASRRLQDRAGTFLLSYSRPWLCKTMYIFYFRLINLGLRHVLPQPSPAPPPTFGVKHVLLKYALVP